MRKNFLFLLALAVLLTLPQAASADRMDVRKPAGEQTVAYEDQGYQVKDDILVGQLDKGKAYYFDTQLTAGLQYVLHFQGDKGVKALKLEVFDEHWKTVAEQTVQDGPVVIKLNPQWSGTFHVKATLVDCVEGFDYWFLLVGFK